MGDELNQSESTELAVAERQESAADCTPIARKRRPAPENPIPLQHRILVRREGAAELLGLSLNEFNRGLRAGKYPPSVDRYRWLVSELLEIRGKPRDEQLPVKRTFERRPRRVPLREGATHLYRHFDHQGRLLYVGISLSAIARLGKHKKSSHWFWSIARIEVTAYATRESALKAERISIKREQPLYNKRHAE